MKDPHFETRSRGGTNRWKGISKEKRTEIMTETGKKRWKPRQIAAKKIK